MLFRIAKPIPKVVECWRKMRNHSAEMKSLIAKCAACFFSEKSNFQPGIGLFIFEKSNRKLRRILFFLKSPISKPKLDFANLRNGFAFCADYPTVGQLSHFAPHGFSWDTSRNLRFISHGETPVAFCADCFFMEHQSQNAPHVPR